MTDLTHSDIKAALSQPVYIQRRFMKTEDKTKSFVYLPLKKRFHIEIDGELHGDPKSQYSLLLAEYNRL